MRPKSCIALVAMCVLFSVTVASASPTPITTFFGPAPATGVAFGTSYTYGDDGLLYAFDGRNVLKQDGLNASSFTTLSTSPTSVVGADAGPIAFAPGGGTIVVGTGSGGWDFSGNSNGIFLTTSAAGGGFTQLATVAPNQYYFTAVTGLSSLLNASNLMVVNQGNATFTGSLVSYYDIDAETNIAVVDDIPGSSSFLTYDSAGNLYVGIGFGASRGEIRRFSAAELDAAYAANTPLDYLTDGELIHSANDNSGTGYFVTPDGHLFVGGGTDGGVTVIDLALAPGSDGLMYNLGKGYASIYYNALHNQFAVTDFDGSVAIYSTSSFMPEPSSLGLVLLIGAGLLARRRAS